MNLDVVGTRSKVHRHRYDWRSLATYALGIGAKRDEIDYLFEKVAGGMKAFPTYAVVPAFDAVFELLAAADVDLSKIVHGAQKIAAARPIPLEGELETTATLSGIYDMKRLAVAVVDTETTHNGEALMSTQWKIFVMGAGGFKGPRPPKDAGPSVRKDRDPDWVVSEATSPEQALLYRLSGDTNPLHADAAFAEKVGFPQGPILHGLCTFGYVARAAIKHQADGDATKLKAMFAQFRKPVWPGDTIVTKGWDVGNGQVALVATVEGRPDPVVNNAWAEIG